MGIGVEFHLNTTFQVFIDRLESLTTRIQRKYDVMLLREWDGSPWWPYAGILVRDDAGEGRVPPPKVTLVPIRGAESPATHGELNLVTRGICPIRDGVGVTAEWKEEELDAVPYHIMTVAPQRIAVTIQCVYPWAAPFFTKLLRQIIDLWPEAKLAISDPVLIKALEMVVPGNELTRLLEATDSGQDEVKAASGREVVQQQETPTIRPEDPIEGHLPKRPEPSAPLEEHFKYYDAVKDTRHRITLKEIASEKGLSPGHVRNRRTQYLKTNI